MGGQESGTLGLARSDVPNPQTALCRWWQEPANAWIRSPHRQRTDAMTFRSLKSVQSGHIANHLSAANGYLETDYTVLW